MRIRLLSLSLDTGNSGAFLLNFLLYCAAGWWFLSVAAQSDVREQKRFQVNGEGGFDTLNESAYNQDAAADEQKDGAMLSSYWLLLGCLPVILFCCCTRPHVPEEVIRRRKEQDFERRLQKINQSLLIKQVIGCDEAGTLSLGDMLEEDHEDENNDDVVHNEKLLSEEEEHNSCMICLEPYRVGDMVAWSKSHESPEKTSTMEHESKECRHVFHRDCIVPWLQHPGHNDCPSCRAVLLLHQKSGEDDAPERSATGVFVIAHGLVSRVRRASYSLIGQIPSEDSADQETSHHLSEPPSFRRAVSFGDAHFSMIQRRRSVGSLAPIPSSPPTRQQRDSASSSPYLQQPVEFRKVVSAGPGSPIHRVRYERHSSIDNTVEILRLPSLRRTTSLRARRRSSSVSWRDESDRTEEDQVIRGIA